jgi:hypothetical protein
VARFDILSRGILVSVLIAVDAEVRMRLRGKGAAVLFALAMASGCSDEWKDPITGSNTTFGDAFGSGLALSSDGQTLAVGAPGEASNATGINGNQDDNSFDGAGAVYVFSREGDRWPQQAYVKASNSGPGQSFGASVALSSDGSTLAVGAAYEGSSSTGINGDQSNGSLPAAGAVYVYRRTGNSWSQEAYVKASNSLYSLQFGGVVALSADGSTLAVGAVGDTSDGNLTGTDTDETGAVYVFTRVGGDWSQQAHLKRSNPMTRQRFGSVVALSADGSTLAAASGDDSSAIGINGDQVDGGGAFDSGAVLVFARAGDAWSQQAYVKASNTFEMNEFGTAVALSADGSLLAVGAPFESSSGKGIDGDQAQARNAGDSLSGAVYLFARDRGTWSQQAYVKASDSTSNIYFGSAVGLAPDGSALFAIAPYVQGGIVYAYTRSGTTWSERTMIRHVDHRAFTSVVSSSDAATVVIGTYEEKVYFDVNPLTTSR